ncbi:MAG TPA: NAD(+)/NADH kinase [Gaiellaceae bacterium]|nr:NAD(+)/NADH kinase [Gaiellaceae bacterium]
MPGSAVQLREAVRRAAVVTHGRPELIQDALARFGRAANEAGVEIVDDDAAPDIAVVLGGDGTMLRALQAFLGSSVPVLGVNFGRVGFLTSIRGPELEAGLARAFAGELEVLELATLDVEAGGERAVAVNDVVAASGSLGRMVEVEWQIGDESLGSVACDGVICATPTGSTAYNLSNGGPVLVWGLDAMAVTFVAPHSLHARSLVVPRSRDVTVRNETLDVDVTVLVDGHELAGLSTGDSVSVRLGDRRALLAVLSEATFVNRYRETFAS